MNPWLKDNFHGFVHRVPVDVAGPARNIHYEFIIGNALDFVHSDEKILGQYIFSVEFE